LKKKEFKRRIDESKGKKTIKIVGKK